ncbi:LysR family transcriptional regulator [Roseburia sp. 499]|uniref:LysR family transcriptional regulator n=1 Tax=Roseburia sp. 499 TaxID=1261634 RepID=UPI00095117E9|nr:LysR family transcriptional regulator [Roseburia sp. 499]WVK69751.1 LysR family transcriptional regulator [Roseburia sp. 499]
MTIIQLKTFLEIASLGNFTLAAESLGYAQSTVTMQIKQLEEELGVELFDRLGKSVVLTVSGTRLIEYAEKIKQLEREILLDVPISDEPNGTLKIGVSETLCYNLFPQYLLAYKKKYPKVEIQLMFVTHDTFPEMLKKGTLDIVYTLNPLIVRDDLLLLYNKPENLSFFASPKNILASKNEIAEKDLDSIPLLLTPNNCNFHNMLITDLKKHDITPKIELETSSKEILKQFAINDLGVTFIPDMSAIDEMKSGKLVKLNWSGCSFPIYSQILIHKDKNVNNAMKEFVNIIDSSVYRE